MPLPSTQNVSPLPSPDQWQSAAPGLNLKREGQEWKGPCPACGGTDRFRINDKGAFCRQCCPDGKDILALRKIIEAAGMGDASPWPAPPAKGRAKVKPPADKPQATLPAAKHTYLYRDADGNEVGAVLRNDGPSGKKISQWCRVDGGWVAKAMPAPRPLYRLPELLAASPKARVAVVEGEKCADAVAAAWDGQVVVTWPGGTNTWRKTDWEPLRGRPVAVIADADEPGRECAKGIFDHLVGLGCEVNIGLPDGNTREDVADWIERDGPAAAATRMAGVLAGKTHTVELEDSVMPTESSNVIEFEAARTGQKDKTPKPKRTTGGAAPKKLRHVAVAVHNLHGNDYAYSPGLGWFARDGGLWAPDAEALGLRNQIAAVADIEAPSLKAHDVARELEPKCAVKSDVWDTDMRWAGLPDGRVLDIEGKQVLDQPPDGVMIARRLGAVPQDGEPKSWLNFLDQTLGDNETIAWLRWWFRTTIAGNTASHDFLFLFGLPGAGKSTLAATWGHVMGSYAQTLAGERIVGNQATQHRQYIAGLAGARFLHIDEIPEKGHWDTAVVLPLASGEKIEANLMRQNSVEFKSHVRLCVTGNHQPRVSGGSGLFRRLRLVQCRHVPASPDQQLRARLCDEAPRILRWALEASPVAPATPDAIESAGEAYRLDADPVAAWCSERVGERHDGILFNAEARRDFETWCERAGHEPTPASTFGKRLTERYGAAQMVKSDGKVVRGRRGYALQASGEAVDG